MSYHFAAERSWGVHHNQGEAKTPVSTSSCFLCLHLRWRPRWPSQEVADPQFPVSAHDPLKSSWSLHWGETCQLLSDEKIHRTCQGGKEEWWMCVRSWLGLHFQGSKCAQRKRNLKKDAFIVTLSMPGSRACFHIRVLWAPWAFWRKWVCHSS